MELVLNGEERVFLLNSLERCQRELLNEIAHTDDRVFRQELVKDEKLLDSLVGRLREMGIMTEAAKH